MVLAVLADTNTQLSSQRGRSLFWGQMWVIIALKYRLSPIPCSNVINVLWNCYNNRTNEVKSKHFSNTWVDPSRRRLQQSRDLRSKLQMPLMMALAFRLVGSSWLFRELKWARYLALDLHRHGGTDQSATLCRKFSGNKSSSQELSADMFYISAASFRFPQASPQSHSVLTPTKLQNYSQHKHHCLKHELLE